jgi:hypothetical protein
MSQQDTIRLLYLLFYGLKLKGGCAEGKREEKNPKKLHHVQNPCWRLQSLSVTSEET